MSVIWKHCILPVMLLAVGTHSLSAQTAPAPAPTQADPLEFQFKLRSGIGFSQPKDHLSRKIIGVGVELGYQSTIGRFSAELGYQYRPGDQYLEDVSKFPVAAGAPPADPGASVDSRKTQMDGITLRLAYGNKLSASAAWHAGLQVGGTKFRQEYLADVADTNWNNYEDTYNGVVYHNATTVSPFAGVVFNLNAASSLEINLMALRYASADYVHVVGTVANYGKAHTSQDYVATKNRTVPHIEIAYGIRF